MEMSVGLFVCVWEWEWCPVFRYFGVLIGVRWLVICAGEIQDTVVFATLKTPLWKVTHERCASLY